MANISKSIFGIKKKYQDEKTNHSKSTEGTKCDSCSYGSNVIHVSLFRFPVNPSISASKNYY